MILQFGNVVGSNIFNICFVLGLPVSFIGGIEHINFNIIDLAVMFIAVFLLFIFSFKDKKINKKEAIVFISIFLIYYTYVIIRK